MNRFVFEIEAYGPTCFDLLLWDRDSLGGPEILGQFDNKVRTWMTAKDVANSRGLSAGDPPWMRFVRLPAPLRRF